MSYRSFILIFCSLFIIAFSLFYVYAIRMPNDFDIHSNHLYSITRIYSNKNEVIAEYSNERREIVNIGDVPSIIKGAFITAEDRNFYKHSGVSYQSLIRAFVENTIYGSWKKRPIGGSTITQQVVKNLLVGNERTFSRKIKEAIMAFRLESKMTKDEILEIYLNYIYLGKGCYGIKEACRFYFAKDMNDIEPHEAAFLAILPSSPSAFMNNIDYEKLREKRNKQLKNMYELGYLTVDQYNTSVLKPIELKMKRIQEFASYFSNEIIRQYSRYMPHDDFFKKGYEIHSTLDKKIQIAAEKAIEDGLIKYTKTFSNKSYVVGNIDKKTLDDVQKSLPKTQNKIVPAYIKAIENNKWILKLQSGKELSISEEEMATVGDIVLLLSLKDGSYELYREPDVTGGVIVIDAISGDVKAMSGGYSFDISSFNNITQAMRQPGSTIKPFVYAAALENGFDQYDIINDSPITITYRDGSTYTPHNYNDNSLGPISIRDALIYSRNLATINLSQKVGLKNIAELLQKANLIRDKFPISGVLGSIELTPLRLISAYSAFLNQGVIHYPRFVKDIEAASLCDEKLRVLLTQKKRRRIMSQVTADTIYEILRDAVKYGTSKKLAPLEEKFGIEISGKTGTTNDFKDAWFVGSIKHKEKTLLICVFVGYQTPKHLGEHCSGSKIALPIVENFINQIYG